MIWVDFIVSVIYMSAPIIRTVVFTQITARNSYLYNPEKPWNSTLKGKGHLFFEHDFLLSINGVLNKEWSNFRGIFLRGSATDPYQELDLSELADPCPLNAEKECIQPKICTFILFAVYTLNKRLLNGRGKSMVTVLQKKFLVLYERILVTAQFTCLRDATQSPGKSAI